MVLGSNLATNTTLIYLVLVVTGIVNTLRFESLWRVLRPWKVPRLLGEKTKKKKKTLG